MRYRIFWQDGKGWITENVWGFGTFREWMRRNPEYIEDIYREWSHT